MIEISVQNLSKKYFAHPVLAGLSMEIKTGEKIGLLGENGCGKTTLFRIIIGEETKDDGDVFLRKNLKLGVLPQVLPDYGTKGVDEVLYGGFSFVLALKERMRIMAKQMENSFDHRLLSQYGEIQSQYEGLGGYEIEEKISKIRKGLWIDDALYEKNYEVLSGGEKRRILLARILLSEPEVLLLDEPTNHLDISLVEWLEQYLEDFAGAALIISHDRYFLDRTVSKIYEIKDQKIETYAGNYSAYLVERKNRYENQMKAYQQKKNKIEQLEQAAKRYRTWGAQADNPALFKKARAVETRLEKMGEAVKPILGKKTLKGNFKDGKRGGKETLRLRNFNLSIGGKNLIENGNITLQYGRKTALIGANGCGKTSFLLKMLSSAQVDGLQVGAGVSFGYIPQDIAFSPKLDLLSIFRNRHPMGEGEARNYLAHFGFQKETVFKRSETLSGGEKMRLLLAMLMRESVNFLVLDEPTNHIDIATREILEQALQDFKGSVLFVSHDRYFLHLLADEVLEIENQSLRHYPFSYSYYREKRKEDMASSLLEKRPKTKEKKKMPKEPSASVETQKKSLTSQIEATEKQIASIDQAMVQNAKDAEKLYALFLEKESLEKALESLLEKWYLL